MYDLSKIGRALGLTLGAAAAMAGVGLVAALRRPLPRTSGKVALPGLQAAVEVRRDRWGVPHIYAAANGDLFAALGYVHAQDRLWQLELNRRTGHGRLAEIFGPVALSSDQFIRTLGFSRIARREADLLDEHSHSVLSAYARGINAWIGANEARLPLEFTILGFTPSSWEVSDLLVWPKMMALNLSANWTSELLNAQLVATLGAERASEIAPRYPEDGPIAVPPLTQYTTDMGAGALNLASAAAPFTGETETPQGSNAWVVGPQRSISGKPLLANDPHLGLGIPGLWYQAHLEGGDYHSAGVTLPGTCGVVIGHNRRIAWGVTNACTDNQDLYIERFHPDDPLRYQWRGEWREAELIRETIRVKGQPEPAIVEVRITHHGPIIDAITAPPESPFSARRHNDSSDAASHEALALRWTALDPAPNLTRAVLLLNRADTWEEFRTALADWNVPPQNFVYADVDGNVGYALGGWIPIRRNHDGQLPVQGWDGAYEWDGFVPNDELPARLNPPAGKAVTANNRIVAMGDPVHSQIRGDWLNPYRAARISHLLDTVVRHDPASFARIQHDYHSIPGTALATIIEGIPTDNALEAQARDLLAAWDGELTADCAGGTIYAALRYHLARVVFQELEALRLAQAGLGAFGGLPLSFFLDRTMPDILARCAAVPRTYPDPWLGGRTWEHVLHESLRRAVSELRALGDNPQRWTYGRVHSLTLRHPLGSVAALAPIFNRGPWPTGGDLDTVAMHNTPRDTVAGPVYTSASWRQIFDLSDWDAARVILPSGQSGHPASRHYADQTAAWRVGAYQPLLWSRAAVERHTADVLTLTPEA
jgi:penicillin G amidase